MRLFHRWREWTLLLAALGAMGFLFTTEMPGRSHRGPPPPLTPEEVALSVQLKRHVEMLAGRIGERNTLHDAALRAAEGYIGDQLRASGFTVRREPFHADGREVANLEAVLPGADNSDEIVVLGAHYDSVQGSPGANDNGTGVAALLEIARLLAAGSYSRTLRFVAFVNEEPPYFQTELMGSRVYARGLASRGEKVVAMLSLETLGWYDEAEGSQAYPPPLNFFYPDTGNFVGFVANTASKGLLFEVISSFREQTAFPSEGAAAPTFIPGIDWSDQWAFWKEGWRALMVTDTAPYRYPYYHGPQDTPDKVQYDKLARVTAGLARVAEVLAKSSSTY